MHVAITGASSGIGEAIARAYAAQGASLTLVARRGDRLAALAASLPVATHVVVHDLSVTETAADWIGGAEQALGPIDVLINNAGVQLIGKTESVDADRGERSLALNVFAPLRLTRAVLPGMKARRHGTVVNIASVAALAPIPYMTYYNASKGALAAASEALRGELRGTGVNVLTVYPGVISETEMGKHGLGTYELNAAARLQPDGSAATLARLVVQAVRARRRRVIYPRFNVLTRWFPGVTRWAIDRYTPPLRLEASAS